MKDTPSNSGYTSHTEVDKPEGIPPNPDPEHNGHPSPREATPCTTPDERTKMQDFFLKGGGKYSQNLH